MRLSDDRINFLSHRIVKVLRGDSTIEGDESTLTVETKKKIIKFLQNEEAVDAKVRAKIASIKRGVLESSKEWEILYEQYYNEEIRRK